ncbi:response regulator [Brevibacillus fulvus]|uniref:Two-component SAPR family response regulator n=1 Tax=Brevibacillus fulvus TaxID=1125967 RepID=A0A938Y014_9BACL|nr:response regulator [Brevibacillus fulvus]MBM7591399.1 two-component SAPR family response regulator [Brevibacillus fulvus]
MRTILIDDEHHALDILQRQLQKVADIKVVGTYTNPLAGKEHILNDEVDLVFLDIHLPEINGIELAEQIAEKRPNLPIVFVTAYDDYAIKAFELNALDYLLKPVKAERLAKTVQRVREQLAGKPSIDSVSAKHGLRINMFQNLSILSGDGQTVPVRWRTAKTQELFLYLLQHRGQLVRKTALTDLLWPEYEIDKAFSQLYTAIYHIRKTMEPFAACVQIANMMDGYVLNLENVRLDVEQWEKHMQAEQPVTAETIQDYEKHMALYAGDYLQEHDYWWAESERQRLKLVWSRITFELAEWYVSCQQYEKAVEKYLEICNRLPLAEEAHFALMKIYAAMNNRVSVHFQYRQLSTLLMEELNELPSPAINDWYLEWKETKE